MNHGERARKHAKNGNKHENMLNGRVVLSPAFLALYHTQYTLLNARFTPLLFAFHNVIAEIFGNIVPGYYK